MRVVLDTNVLLSAFLWQKDLKPIYEAVRDHRLTLLFTPTTWAELRRALRYPKFVRQLQRLSVTPEEVLQLVVSRAEFRIPRERIVAIPADPADNHILAAAVAGEADYIVSGDKHVQNLRTFRGVPIIPPRAFVKMLNGTVTIL